MTGMLADSLNKLFVACLPTYLDDEQVHFKAIDINF